MTSLGLLVPVDLGGNRASDAEERISREASDLEKRLSMLSQCSLASSTGASARFSRRFPDVAEGNILTLQLFFFLLLLSFHLQLQHICCRGRPEQRLQFLLQPIRRERRRQTSVLGGAVSKAAPLQRDGVQLLNAEGSGGF